MFSLLRILLYNKDMEGNRFNFCPKCGSKKIETLENGRQWSCPECGFVLFNNVAASTAINILNAKGEALFEVRAKEPRKGSLALPGGFTEPDETAEESARRECEEEIGFVPKELKIVGIYPNTYVYREITYKTCDVFFETNLPAEHEFKLQESEVAKLEWHDVSTKEAVEALPIAFESTKRALLERLQ